MSAQSLSISLTKIRQQRILTIVFLICLLLVSIVLGLAIGPLKIPALNTINILVDIFNPFINGTHDHIQETVISSLRGPRVVLGVITGAALAVAGACFQSLFRNPLADPGVIGVSAGAATAAVIYIVLGQGLLISLLGYTPKFALPISAMLGALLAVIVLYLFVNRKGSIEVATLLLAGIALNAFCGSVTGILVFISDDQQLRELTFWTLGSLARAQWDAVVPILILLLVVISALVFKGNALNAFSLGEADAYHLGFDVKRIKRSIVIFGAAAVGAAVALTGIIGFVGLVVPHIVRLLIGADNRYVLPASAIAGGGLMLLADMFARIVVQPAEMPIGVITSLIGAPFFLYLLSRRKHLGLSV